MPTLSYQPAFPYSFVLMDFSRHHDSYPQAFLYMYVIFFLSAQGHQVVISVTELKICDPESVW